MIVGHEAATRDADHGVRRAVERDALSDDVIAAAEAALPQSMADNDGVVFTGHKSAPDGHCLVHHTEIIGGDNIPP